jgi:hypothetical protein
MMNGNKLLQVTNQISDLYHRQLVQHLPGDDIDFKLQQLWLVFPKWFRKALTHAENLKAALPSRIPTFKRENAVSLLPLEVSTQQS